MAVSKIMVVIDPTQQAQPAFERALASTKMTGATLHLYVCLNQSLGEGTQDSISASYQLTMESLAGRSEEQGIETLIEMDWGDDWAQLAVSAAARCSASMVFKNSFEHSAVQREMRRTSDWTLMRLCPCPVLMVKNIRDWEHRRVLAAINSQSPDEPHIKLNHQIVSVARQFADTYGSEAHFICAYTDRNHPPNESEIAAICGAEQAFIHIEEGAAAAAIAKTASALEVDLIIIGTVGRSGIKGQVVGNTSERILDRTESDVLVLN